MQLGDMFWGERYGQLIDPFGHSWSASMRIPMFSKTMEEQRAAAMKMFEQGQTPNLRTVHGRIRNGPCNPEAMSNQFVRGHTNPPVVLLIGLRFCLF
jgi:hypothetical protein